jgi:hypothetical protein
MDIGQTYMDIKRKEALVSNRKDSIKGFIAGAVLLAMYAFVSHMDYQDCLRGAISC